MMNNGKYQPRRRRSRALGSGLAFLLAATSVGVAPTSLGAQEAGDEADEVQFTIENLQPGADGFFFTPVWAGLHNGDFDLFSRGERVTDGLEVLAETGDTAPLSDEFAAPGRLQTTVGDGPIGPDAVVEGAIDIINPQAYRYVSFASMIIPSNDAFFGNGDPFAYELFDENGDFNGPITIEILGSELYDAGTEVNTAQGAAGFSLGFDGSGSGESTDDPTGVASLHEGFDNLVGLQTAAGTTIGSEGGGAIDADEVVARITIEVGQGTDDAAAEPVAGFPIDLDFVGLEPLGDGFVYEGWVVVDGTPVSTGRFTIAEIDGDRTYVADSLATQSDLENASDFVLTIEPAVGDDPAPAAAKPLGGAIVDGVAQLTHAHPAALGNDFSSAAGQFIIATPTTADDTSDDYSGVWFLEITDEGPVAGLDLPTLPDGWVYEGWAVIDGQPVSTGRFTDANGPDDFSGFSGPDPSPPYPGEDFIVNAPDGLTFPTDLTDGGTIVLSIEPEDDDSPAPFAFKPLAASVDGAEVETAIELGAGPGFPSGTATIGAASVDDAPVEEAPADAGAFFIVDQKFGRYLEASFGNANTTNVAHTTTEWELVDAGDGSYYIQNAYTRRFLDADESNVGLADSSEEGIRWTLEQADDGSFYIISDEFGTLLNADRPGFNVNTSTEQGPSTSWRLQPVENDATGAVFVGTNDLDENSIASFARGEDGQLTHVGNFATGGAGSTEFDGGEGLDPLISADSIVVTEDEQFLLTVNAGSDTISSFYINDDFSLELISVVDSGGVGPNSVAVQNGYVFVTNIDRDGVALGDADTPRAEPNDEGNVVGFQISDAGELSATGYSFDLDNRPANIGFNAEGNTILVSSITSGSAALTGPNAEASLYSFAVSTDGALSLSDTGTPTLRGNAEGRNLPSAIDFDVQTIAGREFVVVTEAREFNSEGGPPALPALQAGSVTVYELAADGSLSITESDLATTSGDAAAPNAFGADGQQLTACWIDFGHDGSTFYVSNAINATISSFTLNADGTVSLIDTVAAAGTSGFAEEGVAIDGPTTFGTTDGFIDLDVSPDGNQLYQLAGLSGEIYVFDVEADGSLTQTQIISDGLPEIDTQGLVSIG